MFVPGKPFQPSAVQHSSLLGHSFVKQKIKCYEYGLSQELSSRGTRLGDFSPIGLLLEAHCDFLKI